MPESRKPARVGTTVSELIKEGEDLLSRNGISTARLEAEVLLARSQAIPRSALLIDPDTAVAPSLIAEYRDDLARRATRYPLQYITGTQEFYSLDFDVDERVLIPRAETEMIVDEVLRLAGGGDSPRPGLRPAAGWSQLLEPMESRMGEPRRGTRRGRSTDAGGPSVELSPPTRSARERPKVCIVDVGTGSGCIAVVLAVRLETSEILATDVSAPALEVARNNAAKHGVSSRIQLEEGGGLQPALRRGWSARADFIVSNPPYIAASEIGGLQKELSYEPAVALSPGPTGLEVIRPLILDAANVLKPGGWLMMELSAGRSAEVSALLDPARWDSVEVKPDLQGIPRLLLARRRP